MNTTDKIAIMQAYADGQPIEYTPSIGTSDWDITSDPTWDWASFDYRIKPSFEFNFPPTIYRADNYGVVEVNHAVGEYVKEGIARATRAQAEQSYARQLTANRLEQLVYQFQDTIESTDVYIIRPSLISDIFVYEQINTIPAGSVTMNQNTAEQICKLLNNKEVTI